MSVAAGIGLSNDKVLQTRALSYSDTQRYRIGTNYQMLPINAPKCPFHNSHENGALPWFSEPHALGSVKSRGCMSDALSAPSMRALVACLHALTFLDIAKGPANDATLE